MRRGALVLRRQVCCAIGPQFCRHAAFFTPAPSDLNDLPGPKLGEPKAPECFDVNKDVLRAFAAGQEPEASDTVKPLHHGPLPVAFWLNHDMRALRDLAWVNRSGFVHAQYLKRLQSLWTPQHLTVDTSPLVRCLVAAGP